MVRFAEMNKRKKYYKCKPIQYWRMKLVMRAVHNVLNRSYVHDAIWGSCIIPSHELKIEYYL